MKLINSQISDEIFKPYDLASGLELLEKNNLLSEVFTDGKLNTDLLHKKVQMIQQEQIISECHKYKITYDGRFWKTYVPDPTDEKHHRKLIKRKERADLNAFLANFYQTGLYFNPTLMEMFNSWNDARLQDEQISSSTHYRNAQAAHRYLQEFGQRRLREISMIEMQEFIESIPKTIPIKAKAYSDIKSIIKGTLVYSKRECEKLVPYSVRELFYELMPVKCKPVTRNDEEDVFSIKETEVIVKHLTNDTANLKSLGLLLVFLTGIRIGELVSLSGSDFLIEGNVRYIHVHKTESRYSDDSIEKQPGKRQRSKGNQIYYLKDSPKTEAGDRRIPIPSDYNWLWTRLKANASIVNDHDSHGNSITINAVFHKAGKRLHTEAFRKEIYKICDLLEIPRRSPHKIRKTYASILMDAKADSLTVTNLMGHTEIRTTENFYHRNRKTMGKKQELVDSIPEFQVAK